MGKVENSSLLRSLFEGDVIAREHHGPPALAALHPDEAGLVSHAVESRRLDFAAGRLSARSALAALGAPTGPLLANRDRAPLWPPHVVGSITHTGGFCGAVVASQARYRGLGIDAELRAHVSEELWEIVLTPNERRHLHTLPASCRTEIATIIFSAKEAFYKCQYQLTGAWVGFEGAEVVVGTREFGLTLTDQVGCLAQGQQFAGRFELLPSLVVTGIAFSAC